MPKQCRSRSDHGVQPREVRYQGDGLALAGEAFGDPAAPPVLFFHGGGQSRSAWRGSAINVAKAGFYGISFDLRGHGASQWAEDGDYLLDAYARDVEALLNQFDHRVSLVGASRGGQAALVGGSRHPAKVRLIMLADVAPNMRDYGVDGIRAFFADGFDGFSSVADAAVSLHRHLGRPLMDDLAGLAKSMRQAPDGRWHWHWDPQTGASEFLHPPSENQAILDAAARVRSPVMLVRAGDSHLLTDEGVAKFHKLTPQLETIIAPGAKHMFTADRNDDFSAELLNFLSRHPEVAAT